MIPEPVRRVLNDGTVIPAMPLALSADRKLDERRQRALIRYYDAAGAGGLAVGVHTTQFAIRDPEHGLFRPVLQLAAEELSRADARRETPIIRIAGACGPTSQAVAEAELARDLGYHAVLLSLSALSGRTDDEMLAHCRAVGQVIPLVGFYLQEAVGGPVLSRDFWRGLADLESLVAIKIAPFNRYRTFDVVRAVAESGRDDVALYTGNDDNIVLDLLTPYPIQVNGRVVERRIVGGLLGHWSVWTRKAVELLDDCRAQARSGSPISADWLSRNVEVTDANAAFFDPQHNFAGCIAGIHEVLRRQGLLEGTWCLDPNESLSPGQAEEIDRVYRAYPSQNDDAFVKENLDGWLSG